MGNGPGRGSGLGEGQGHGQRFVSPGGFLLTSCLLLSFLCFSLCFQGERGMPGLPGRHGSKVPRKQQSDACLPGLTHTSRLSLMCKHRLDLCVCLSVNGSPQLNSFCF